MMASFSQRHGLTPARKALQIESLDKDLRISLWNTVHDRLIGSWTRYPVEAAQNARNGLVKNVARTFWGEFMKQPLDDMPDVDSVAKVIRKILLNSDWYVVLDALEFIAGALPEGWRIDFRKKCNRYFEIENSGYRFIDAEIVAVSDQNEISAIEDALQHPSESTTSHLRRALELISDKQAPDYPNAMKESISAVEAACQAISGKPGGALSDCLRAISARRPLHAAFEKALLNLFGYASDSGGIRHARKAGDNFEPTYSDAKFMLLACTSFINYLWGVAAESNLSLAAAGETLNQS